MHKGAFPWLGKRLHAGWTRFIQKLWAEANAHFREVQPLAKKDGTGNLAGIWGVMSDFSRSFQPWEDHFSKGLYLAGVECADDAQAPEGWTKWKVPGYEYLCAEAEDEAVLSRVLDYMRAKGSHWWGLSRIFPALQRERTICCSQSESFDPAVFAATPAGAPGLRTCCFAGWGM